MRVLRVMVLMCCMPVLAHAFGAPAHRTVGHIADRFICPETRSALMAMSPLDLAEAGVWADKIRAYPEWDEAKPWHYINVPDGVAVAAAPRRPEGDVLLAIGRFYSELADPGLPVERRREALYFLIHFVADVHQPLHVGRRDDRGGNRVDVIADRRKTSLHAYWDRGVFGDELDNPVAAAARLAVRYQGSVASWQASAPLDWAGESLSYRPDVYAFGPSPGQDPVRLSSEYQSTAQQIAELRLAQAGIRVAGLLDSIWCGPEDSVAAR